MSQAEFERLVDSYLDRSATPAEVARLRELLVASPELTRRFKQRSVLHRAQLKCLADFQRQDWAWVDSWLLNFAQRFNRSAAHLCLLMVVLVQTRVTMDTDYKGLNLYVMNSLSGQEIVEAYEGDESEKWVESSVGDFWTTDVGSTDAADDDDEG
jgi:hypothetical protein